MEQAGKKRSPFEMDSKKKELTKTQPSIDKNVDIHETGFLKFVGALTKAQIIIKI
jgi:hypothetical protein